MYLKKGDDQICNKTLSITAWNNGTKLHKRKTSHSHQKLSQLHNNVEWLPHSETCADKTKKNRNSHCNNNFPDRHKLISEVRIKSGGKRFREWDLRFCNTLINQFIVTTTEYNNIRDKGL